MTINRDRRSQTADEYLDVLDAQGEKMGERKLRKEIHRDGDWHRVVHVWLINSQGEILLQRRSTTRETHPGMLDVSCAGHLSAGETAKAGALREVAEELGLKIAEDDLESLATIKRSGVTESGIIDNQYIDIFLVRMDWEVEDFKLQTEEVAEIFYVSLSELEKMVVAGRPDLVDRGDEYPILFQKLGG